MTSRATTKKRLPAVAIIAPFPPPYGGMALQAEKLFTLLTASGIHTLGIQSNVKFPQLLAFTERIQGIRTFVRFIIFLSSLFNLKQASVIQIFGASHWYFFLVVAPAIVMAGLLKKKIILNYRGGEAEIFLSKWGFLAIPLMKKADIISVPSHFLKDVLEKATDKEVLIVPNVIDTQNFKHKERQDIKPYIVVSRQLEPRYNIACAIRAFKIIKDTYPEAKLKIAGTGSEKKNLKKLSDDLELRDVYFLGALSHDQLALVYDECDIMINSSNTDNFPGAILEAFACGLPVVTTNAGGIPFMVREGENGILVDPDDHAALARGVFTLLHNPSLVQSFSMNGRRVAEEHSWENIKNKLFHLYGIQSQ
jgi:glycosyltransferase involved in cell wall biosynthesis